MWYEELKSWQAGIGSAMGFIALIAGALFNFHLTRRRDTEARRVESTAVAAALYGELLLMESQLAQTALAVASLRLECPERAIGIDFLDRHRLPEPVLYPSLASKLGHLDPEIVLSLTAFHAEFQFARAALPLIVSGPDTTQPHEVVLFLRPAVEAIEKVQTGIELLEVMVRAPTHHRAPDLRAAQDVLELEM